MKLQEITQFQNVHDQIEQGLELVFNDLAAIPNLKTEVSNLGKKVAPKIQKILDKIIDQKLGYTVVGPTFGIKFYFDDDIGTNARFSSMREKSVTCAIDIVDQLRKLYTEIFVGYNFGPNYRYWQKNGTWSKAEIARLATTIAHELQHFFQYIKRQRVNYAISCVPQKQDEFIRYMSRPGEVEAYSAQAARELVNSTSKNPDLAKKLLKNSSQTPAGILSTKSATLGWLYSNKNLLPAQLFQTYLKKIYQYIDVV